MNQLEGLLILLGLPACLLLTGYWLAALLPERDPLDRLAFALPCGVAVLLAEVAAVNFYLPLAGPWAYACLAPIALTLALPRSRAGLWQDLTALARTRTWLPAAVATLFFVLLLWPVLISPASLFYDGTSNHDSFFWIAGAEHLKRHTYMEMPVASAVQPLTSPAAALVGFHPAWGRMGAEGLLALASSVVGVSPLKLYLYGTASLAFVWIACGWLALRTFVHEAPTRAAGLALIGCQPIFVFFYGNANLPNLLGTLTGTAAIVAVERMLRAGPADRAAYTAWAALAALSLHGLLCSYPEMGPFILLPCGLLWLRPWFTRGPAAYWRPALLAAIVLTAGLILNPATTVRAVNGFVASFVTARADANWANLFNPLDLVEYVPGLVTLSISGSKELDLILGGPLSLLIVVGFGLVVWHSRDRLGLLAGLSGGAVLLLYTLVTGFAYGWQKTVQFSGIFIALTFPVTLVDLLWRRRPEAGRGRLAAHVALAGALLFGAYATFMNCRDIYKWSDRKVISSDWFALRDYSRANLNQLPVLVEAASFRMAFFHGMWAAYFLPESDLYFGARGEESGGYLRAYVVNESNHEIPPAQAVLVGRPWAEAFDANSTRLLTGREYALVRTSNRVLKLAGVYPLNGLPDHASGRVNLEVLPHSDSILQLELRPHAKAGWPAGEWRLTRQVDGAPDFSSAVTGASPWRLAVPLVGGRRNVIEIRLAGAATPEKLSFAVRDLRIVAQP